MCSALPDDLDNMNPSIDTPLPVFYGDTLTVTCKTGYSLTNGDPTIHCEAAFSFGEDGKPVCEQGIKIFQTCFVSWLEINI